MTASTPLARGHHQVEARIDAEIAPFAEAVARLDEIPGVGLTAAQVIIAEVGLDMTRFPTPAHLAPGPGSPPGSRNPPAARRATARPATATATWPARWARQPSSAAKTDTFLGERYRRIARRRGKKKAAVAVGRSILVIVWHLLSHPRARFVDLGPGLLRHPHGH